MAHVRQRTADNRRNPSLETKVDLVRTLDRISATICSVVDPAELCRNTHPSEEWVGAAEDCYAQLSTLIHHLNTDTSLYHATATVTNDGDGDSAFERLTPEQQIAARAFKLEFELSGIHLPDDKRMKVVAINEDITALAYEFSVAASSGEDLSGTSLRLDESSIASLPPKLAKSVRRVGTQAVLPLNPNVLTTVLQHVENGALRRQAFVLSQRHSPRALKLLDALLLKRDELAQVLEFPSYAALSLANRMAKKPSTVHHFLDDLSRLVKGKADKEIDLLKGLKRQKEGAQDGGDTTIYGWDRLFYSEMCKTKTNLNEYFSLGHCMAGLNTIVSNLFGLSLDVVPMDQSETWHPSVRKIRVTHETEGTVGYVYMDLFSRPNKFSHAANFAIQFSHLHATDAGNAGDSSATAKPWLASELSGGYVLPRVALVCNFGAGPTAQRPSLLSHHDVETLFHEFGHTLATMLSRTEFQHVAGTRAQLDFVETPSTLMEYYAYSPRVLSLFARHWRTGAPIPESDLAALQANAARFGGMEAQLQVLYSMMDLRFHDAHPLPASTTDILRELQNRYYSIPYAEGTNMQASFGHLSGYGAGYYSYLFCRVFSANIWHRCFEHDPLNRQMGERYRAEILRYGGAKDPNEMMRALLGTEPSVDAYLTTLGLNNKQ